MAAKICKKCGKKNPRFLTHCIGCGTKLADDAVRNAKLSGWARAGLVAVAAILLLVFVILPAIEYSHTFGRNLSETVSAKSAEDLQKTAEYPLDHPVANEDVEIRIGSARDGQNTYNNNRFYLAAVSIRNIRQAGNVQVYSSDFELVDSAGATYVPYGIGSKVMHDLSPGQSASEELTFVIPRDAVVKAIRFTFPGETALAGNRDVAVFVI
jgi:hypothetical protein